MGSVVDRLDCGLLRLRCWLDSLCCRHLKRFSSKAQTVAKLDEHVPFPLVLDFSPFACKAEPVDHMSKWHEPSNSAEVEMLPEQLLQVCTPAEPLHTVTI